MHPLRSVLFPVTVVRPVLTAAPGLSYCMCVCVCGVAGSHGFVTFHTRRFDVNIPTRFSSQLTLNLGSHPDVSQAGNF